MEQLSATRRIELEIEIRKSAIEIATRFGIAGIEFFSRKFPGIARKYAHALDEEQPKIGFKSSPGKQ